MESLESYSATSIKASMSPEQTLDNAVPGSPILAPEPPKATVQPLPLAFYPS